MRKQAIQRIIVMMLVLGMVFSGFLPGSTYEAMASEVANSSQTATIRVERIGETDVSSTTINFTQGETAYDVLKKVATVDGIDMISKINGYPDKNSKDVYWMFRVNGKLPMLDASTGANANQYIVQPGDSIEFYAIYYGSVNTVYSYFEHVEYETAINTPFEVKLLKDDASMGDLSSNVSPVNGAKIIKSVVNVNKATIETSSSTNSEGIAEIFFDKAGTYILSATSKNVVNGKEQISRPYAVVKVTSGGAIDADLAVVNADKELLTIKNINENIVAIDQLELVNRGESRKTIIEWSSSDESIISSNGVVNRPAYPSDKNLEVTLTATIKKGFASVNKEFKLQVKPYTLEETETDLKNVIKSLSAIHPVYGTDINVVTLLNSTLAKKGRSDVKVEFVSANNIGSEESSFVIYIGANGNIDNWYDNTSNTNNKVAQVNVNFKFNLNTVEQESAIIAVIPLDNDKIIKFMTEQDVNLLTEDAIKNENVDLQNVKTQLILPSEIGSKKSWITWESNSDLIKIEGNSLDGYKGNVTIPTEDTEASLTATFKYRFSDDPITVEKIVPITIKAVSGNETDIIKAELSKILEENFTIEKFGEYVAIEDSSISLQEDYKNNNVRYNFKVPDIRRQIPKDVTYTHESSDPSLFSFEVFKSGFVNYVARVVRPNIGENKKTANVTITMTKKGVSVEKVIPFTIAPLTQVEIDEEIALMEKVKANIWEGINDGNNIDKDNIANNLNDIYCVYEKDGKLVWGYDYKAQTGTGFKPDDLFPNPSDPYDTEDSYKFDPSGYFSEVTMKLSKRPDKDTNISFKTCFTSQLLGKYAEIYPNNEDLKKLCRNEVSLDLILKAINPNLKSITIEGVDFTFDSKATTYNILTDNVLNEAKITVTPENVGATIKINEEIVNPNEQHIVSLVDGSTDITISSEDSSQTKTYKIVIVSKKFLEDEIAKLPDITETDEVIFAQKDNVEKLLVQYNKLDDTNKAKISNGAKLIEFNTKLQEVIEANINLILQKELDNYLSLNYTDEKAILDYENGTFLDFDNIIAPKIKLNKESYGSKYSYKWSSSDEKIIDIMNTSGYAYVNRDESVDKTVIVTLTLTNKENKEVTATKEFTLTIKKFTDDEKNAAIDLVKEILTKTDIEYADGENSSTVKSDIKIVKNKPTDTSKQYDYNYTWTSSDNLIAEASNGKGKIIIERPNVGEDPKIITITLNITHKQIKSATVQKTFEFTVIPISNEDILAEKNNLNTIKDNLFDGIKNENTSVDAVTKNLEKALYAKVNADGTIRWNTGNYASKKSDDNVEIQWISSSDKSFVSIDGYSGFKLSKRPNQGEDDKIVTLTAKVKSLVYPDKVDEVQVELNLTIKAYNAYLSSLKLSSAEITFDKNTLEYECVTDKTLDTVTVTPILENTGAELSVNSSKITSGSTKDIALTNGCGTIKIEVEDGKKYSYSTPKAKSVYKIVVVSKKYLEDEIALLPTTDENILLEQGKIESLNNIYSTLSENGKSKIVNGNKIVEIYEKLEKFLKEKEEKEVKVKLNSYIDTNYVTNDKFITLSYDDNDKNSITEDFKLKKEGYSSNYTTEWSSKSSLVSFDVNTYNIGAEVNRPSFEDGDKKIAITLKLIDDDTDIFVTRDFEVAIKALDKSSSDALKKELQGALDACYLENKDETVFDAQSVKMPFKLEGKDTSYNWKFTSTDEEIVKPSLYKYSESIVSRPSFEDGNKEVTITLSISKDGSSMVLSKLFKLNVIALTKEETELTNADFKKALEQCTIIDAAGGSFDINNIKNKKLKLNLPEDRKVKGTWEVDTGINVSGGTAFKIATVKRPSMGEEDIPVIFTLTLSHVESGKVLVKTFSGTIKAETEADRENELLMLKKASEKIGEFIKGENTSLDAVMVNMKRPDSVAYLSDGSFLFNENGFNMPVDISFNGLYYGESSKYLSSNLSLKKRPDFGSENVKVNITAVLESNNYGYPYIKYEYPMEITIKAYTNLLNSINIDGVELKVPSNEDIVEAEILDTKEEISLSAILVDPTATMKLNGEVLENKEEKTISVIDNEQVQITTNVNDNEKTYTIKFVKVKQEEVTVEWPSFRGTLNNMAIVNCNTPRVSGEANLEWSSKLTSNWTENSSNIIIAEDFIWVVIKNELVKFDKDGNIIEKISLSSNAAYNTYITYGDRTVFVAFENGIVEAVDTVSMKSKWVSKAVADGHDVATPILYNEGYVYAGTSEDRECTNGYYFCISAEDGSLKWKNQSEGKGYYWAGALAVSDAIVYGNDDGLLLSVNALTGETIDSYQADGAIRSCVSTTNGTLYFTTKNGKLYSIKINNDGLFDESTAKSSKISINATQSTSTPVVFNDRVYVGAVNADNTGAIGVLNATSLEPIYEAELPANVQSSALLTTAYDEADNEKIYVYFTYNKTPGGIVVLEDFEGNKTPIISELYIPEKEKQNYCISSIISDSNGTMYYKNDSGYMFAIDKKDAEGSPVNFIVNPSDAIVVLKNSNEEKINEITKNTFDLKAGIYNYVASKEGYKDALGSFEIIEEDSISHSIKNVFVVLSKDDTEKPTPTEEITVTFTLIGDKKHKSGQQCSKEIWIPQKTYKVPKDSTVKYLTDKILIEENIPFTTKDNGTYISSINGLAEFDNGKNSGWLYSINGTHENIDGYSIQILKDGDAIVWHYTSEYTQEEGMDSWVEDSSSTTITEATVIEETANVTATTQAEVDNDGKATATLTEKELTEAITSVVEAAKKAGENTKTVVTIDAKSDSKAKEVEAKLPVKALKEAEKQNVDEIKISSQLAEITLNKETLKSILNQSKSSEISISVANVEKETLKEVAKTIVGDRPVFDFNISSGNKKISRFDDYEIKLGIPYILKANENPEKIVIHYIDDNGNIQTIRDCKYDSKTKTVKFETEHLSYYAVGYEPFEDIANHWAKEAINYVYSKGLFNGSTDDEFSPNQSMTRGMFVTVLGRLAEADTSYTATGFSDVSQNEYYAPYIRWALDNKLVSGKSSNTFAPNKDITREEMSVILANYVEMLSKDVTQEPKDFADEKEISSWAEDSVKLIQSLGLIQGKDGNKFDPKSTATRAEVAVIFQRLTTK
ncbi:S-layer homology domain-containing protein [Sedimentibacter sp. zth1]|uniref:immunoglobulin-like domain-containing protein n=1 Tax=Sedimentibacter sp. zth1 TaxID=2816908 RepID=UPI001A91AD8C|nr:immunoglobulin-like domain-containing protein [Sedimentibacter sp. zth1]QSX04861.1 S-layer homology domain-containing protein [Sedimentibacter sp. zth1]